MVDAAPVQRIIPGAPPPPPVSKSQKKKRKTTKSKESDEPSHGVEIPDSTAAALTETAPTLADIQNENVAGELVAPLETINENAAENMKKSSCTVEFINKRIKMQTKKAVSFWRLKFPMTLFLPNMRLSLIMLIRHIAVPYSFLCLQGSFRAQRGPEEISRITSFDPGWYQGIGGDEESYRSEI